MDSQHIRVGDKVERIVRGFGAHAVGTVAEVAEITAWGNLRFGGDVTPYDQSFYRRLPTTPQVTPTDPLQVQISGDHYKHLHIQPVEYIHANSIPYLEGNVIKYVTRWRDKGGLKDLEKARHYIDLLINLESKGTP